MPVENCLSIQVWRKFNVFVLAPESKHQIFHHLNIMGLIIRSSNCLLLCWIPQFFLLTCSRSLSWWPMMADAWWGYFCLRCSRNASLFLSMSGGCILRISREPRAPPNVCLRGTVRLPLASPFEGAVPFGDSCRRLRCSLSSGDVTFRLLLVCSDGRERQRVEMCFFAPFRFWRTCWYDRNPVLWKLSWPASEHKSERWK